MKSTSLNIQRESSGEHEITLTVTVDTAEMAERLDTALRDHQKRAKMDGFRPGKVPMNILKQRYGSAIRAQVVEDTIDETYKTALEQENLHPVAMGNIKDVQFNPDSPLVYKAVVPVAPEFTLADLSTLSVEREIVTIRDEDINQTLQDLREESGVLSPLEGEAKEGTIVECDLQELDTGGLPLVGKVWKDLKIEIGKSPFGPEVDQQLIGITANQSRQVVLKPQASPTQNDAPKEIRYQVTANALKNKELPELNDEFAHSIDDKVDTLDQLKDNIRKYWEGRTSREAQERFTNRLVDAVLKAHPFTLPKAMIDDYMDRLVESTKKSSRKDREFDEKAFREQSRAGAIWNLKWMLVRRKLEEQESLTATDQDIEDAIKGAVEAGGNEDQIRMTYKVPERRQELLSDLTERKILKWLEQKAIVTDRHITTDDFYGRKSIVLPK
jgi:trigger factor